MKRRDLEMYVSEAIWSRVGGSMLPADERAARNAIRIVLEAAAEMAHEEACAFSFRRNEDQATGADAVCARIRRAIDAKPEDDL